jgi:hypothetical protein
MDIHTVLGILGLAAAAFSTLWATGGWSALRRRAIQQELDLAKQLPESSVTRGRLTAHAEQQIEIYLYRIQKQPPQVRLPARIFFLDCIIVAATLTLFPNPPRFVSYVIAVFVYTTFFWMYAVFMRSVWLKWSRHHHDKLLKAARHVADTAGAAKGQRAEHA